MITSVKIFITYPYSDKSPLFLGTVDCVFDFKLLHYSLFILYIISCFCISYFVLLSYFFHEELVLCDAAHFMRIPGFIGLQKYLV